VLEPVKEYTREDTVSEPATGQTPLIRVVDAVSLESRTGREFSEMVDKFVGASFRDEALGTQLRAQLIAWRENDAKLQPLAQRSFLVKEVAASSQDLSTVAAAGLAALDAMEHGGKADEAWKTQQVAALQQAQKPKGQYLLIPAAAIQKLVEVAAAGGSCAAVK